MVGYVQKLGLTVERQTQKTVPQTYKEDIYSSTLGMTVKSRRCNRNERSCYNNNKRRNNTWKQNV